MLKGSLPALITPFRNGELDLETLKKLVEWHIGEGSDGLVPVGTTGESADPDPPQSMRPSMEDGGQSRRRPGAGRGGCRVEQHGRRAIRFVPVAPKLSARMPRWL